MKSFIKKILLAFIPDFFWSIFFVKRVMSPKKCFGFLSEEFFSEEFLKNKLCDIGGFGMTSKVISQYFGQQKNKVFEVVALFNRTLHNQSDWRNLIDGSLVSSIPDLSRGYLKNYLKYSYKANRDIQFLLSIDLYPGYDFFLSVMPKTPLMIYLRDPKSEIELDKIATVEPELRATKYNNAEEFRIFAKKERDFFAKIYSQSQIDGRPIIFVTNAQFLIPRGERLYNVKEMNAHFLPNPIHYVPQERIIKSKRPSVCMLGRIDPVKRPWIYFELAKKFKDVDFYVCGNPSYPDIMNPITEKYRSVENLKFLGLVQGEKKERILTESWILINTSIHEGLPCSFLEALSCQTPLLSSVNPDNLVSNFGIYTGDNLGDGLEEKTLGQFQEALGRMLSDEKSLKEKGFEARKYIEKIYTFEMFQNNLQQILSTQFKSNFKF